MEIKAKKNNMTLAELIQIANVGFPEWVKQCIDFENVNIFHRSGVYRLYDKNTPFIYGFPKEDILSITIEENNFVQINPGKKAFNHYAAIKEMEILNLIKKTTK